MEPSLYLALALFGGFILLLSLFGGAIKSHLYASEPAIALAVGILIGPQVLNVLALDVSQDVPPWVEHVARVTLAIALLDIATDLPVGYLQKNLRAIGVMIGMVMPLMCIISGALAWAILGLPVLAALLVGAVVTPTDPVVSSAVVSGSLARRALPSRVRNLLLAEAGANDALAFALVMLPILLLTTSPTEAWQEWLFSILLWELTIGAVLGVTAGLIAGIALQAVKRSMSVERASLLTVSITLTLSVLGVAKLIHTEGLIAVFASGLVFNRYFDGELQEVKEHVHEALRRLFELPVFIILGMILPWSQWHELGWPVLAFALGVVLLRRSLVLVALWRLIPSLHSRGEAWFVGWFGPIGIAALLYATLAVKKAGIDEAWVAGTLVIALSVGIHGCTATPLTRVFRASNGNRDDPNS